MLEKCPYCHSDRLAVLYYDAQGNPIGGHSQCTECGPREAVPIPSEDELRTARQRELLEKKAS